MESVVASDTDGNLGTSRHGWGLSGSRAASAALPGCREQPASTRIAAVCWIYQLKAQGLVCPHQALPARVIQAGSLIQ